MTIITRRIGAQTFPADGEDWFLRVALDEDGAAVVAKLHGGTAVITGDTPCTDWEGNTAAPVPYHRSVEDIRRAGHIPGDPLLVHTAVRLLREEIQQLRDTGRIILRGPHAAHDESLRCTHWAILNESQQCLLERHPEQVPCTVRIPKNLGPDTAEYRLTPGGDQRPRAEFLKPCTDCPAPDGHYGVCEPENPLTLSWAEDPADLVLERPGEDSPSLLRSGTDDERDLYRVRIADRLTVVGFRKFATVGIGYGTPLDVGSLDLPYSTPAAEIYQHIGGHHFTLIPRDVQEGAIRMIQRAVQDDRETGRITFDTARHWNGN